MRLESRLGRRKLLISEAGEEEVSGGEEVLMM